MCDTDHETEEYEFETARYEFADIAIGEESDGEPEEIHIQLEEVSDRTDLKFEKETEETSNEKPTRAGRGFNVRYDKVSSSRK